MEMPEGKLADSGNESPLPTASVAKVMTALVVMDDKPFPLGQTGGSITIADVDVQGYHDDKAQEQSVVAVQTEGIRSSTSFFCSPGRSFKSFWTSA